jgi:hypothetical protein
LQCGIRKNPPYRTTDIILRWYCDKNITLHPKYQKNDIGAHYSFDLSYSVWYYRV